MKKFGFNRIFDSRRVNHSIQNTGLFGYSKLDGPDGIRNAAKLVTQQAIHLSQLICDANSAEELRKTVKRVDTISDMLCSVLDVAELLRNVHPDPLFVNAANQVCSELHQFLSELNTNQELYQVIKILIGPQKSL